MTSFTTLYKAFANNLREEDYELIEPTQRKLFINNVLPEFSVMVRTITVDFEKSVIIEDLNPLEILLIGKFLYREWLSDKQKQWAEVTGIVSDAIKITGIDGIKKSLKDLYQDNEQVINRLLASFI